LPNIAPLAKFDKILFSQFHKIGGQKMCWGGWSSPHAPVLATGSWNSKRKWVPERYKGRNNFRLRRSKLENTLGLKVFPFPAPSSKKPSGTYHDFLHAGPKWQGLKTLKVSRKLFRRKLVKFRDSYIGRMPGIC